eukprot:TRINITY_DN3681_c0_g1_i1.p1 TRINITY_DN3681_c0_g1~~TRINITY_DN3681_c0_g1_i1.p1  ORF type:complete len:162 (+),score=47.41 TRINITY_DN3681_c0_g1_i1:60-545(+)
MSLRKALTPVNAILGAFSVFGNLADKRVVKYHNSDFGANLKRAEQTGEDLGNTAWGRFVAQSVLTIPDRFISLGKELTRLPMACNILAWGPADYLEFIQFFIRIMFVFLVFKMIGRDSMVSLVGPSSIFWQTDEPVDTNTERAEKIRSATEWAAPVAALLK